MCEYVKKLWGIERWLHNGVDYCMKILELQPGYQSSLHWHKVKSETFLIVAGRVKLEVMFGFQTPDVVPYIKTMFLRPYQHYTLQAGTPHRFTAIGSLAIIVEASMQHDDQDVYRIEDSRAI